MKAVVTPRLTGGVEISASGLVLVPRDEALELRIAETGGDAFTLRIRFEERRGEGSFLDFPSIDDGFEILCVNLTDGSGPEYPIEVATTKAGESVRVLFYAYDLGLLYRRIEYTVFVGLRM